MSGASPIVTNPSLKRPAARGDRSRGDAGSSAERAPDALSGIIELLRTRTAHDFTLYKPGALQRRVERRIAMAAVEPNDMDRYLEILRKDPAELDLLAKDLLINVTSFFLDPRVFEYLADKIIPDLVADALPERPLRIWIAGCSTGEEAYSLAMLFCEAIAAARSSVKLQVFASDVNSDAVAVAREGLYPESITQLVSPARLARFFSREDRGYRVLPDLRAAVVFTVQDLLADPPFSRLDMVSCRNLLIHLGPAAQAKVIALFNFALRENGILLLGGAETVGIADGFEPIAKSERLYRHVGQRRPGDLSLLHGQRGGVRASARPGGLQLPSRKAVLAELCRRLVLESYAPVTVLLNHRHEILYSVGRIERFLSVAEGYPTQDLLALARREIRPKLRAAMQQAEQAKRRVVLTAGRVANDGPGVSFSIDVRPVQSDGEALWLVCFVDEPTGSGEQALPAEVDDEPAIARLQRELDATRIELQSAIRNLEISGEEQRAINREVLSVNEEFQSTNEELLASKQELQSLNEELTALNGELQETLERQRTTFNDLQNVLYSTDVATIFLDPELNIRFFTPATRSLFRVIPSDIGRPLADLNSLASDSTLLDDARAVLESGAPFEREIETGSGAWFIRRILPYRTDEQGIEGVVITFHDITEQRRTGDVLRAAKREAELATAAKSRFLAIASHDLRQPLQTLALLQGLLAKTVESDRQRELVSRLEATLGGMSGVLNALFDITQIEAGIVQAEKLSFPIGRLLERLRGEFIYHANAHDLELRVVPCAASVHSDPQLLEQMIRNLLSNALKYTKDGRVLLGCRRRGGMLSVEIWDTGVGIRAAELQAIFDEFHQVDNATPEPGQSFGLGLSIVKRLGDLLNHQIRVRSQPGRGSVFSVEVPLALDAPGSRQAERPSPAAAPDSMVGKGAILVVENDPEMRGLLELLLREEGYLVASAGDGATALDMIAKRLFRADLLLADYDLPNGLDGLQLVARLRETLRREIPVVMLTGDISARALRDIGRRNCVQLHKPVKAEELTRAIQLLIRERRSVPPAASIDPNVPVIHIVDDDSNIGEAIRQMFEEEGRAVETYTSSEAFLDAYRPGGKGCLLIDAYLPGMDGFELLQTLRRRGLQMPSIMITGTSDVPMAVRAMRAGASDFIEKPIGRAELVASVERALDHAHDSGERLAGWQAAADRIGKLTSRQHQIMDLVLAGHPSKNIAADLGISQRTVENHRASIMKKTGSKSLPALVRLAVAAAAPAGQTHSQD